MRSRPISSSKLRLPQIPNPTNSYNIDNIIERLTNHCAKSNKNNNLKVLHEIQIRCLLQVTTDIFLRQPALVTVNAPITVCGDIHGQFEDLMTIFKINGAPSSTNKYLFLGDYVDRGSKSTQCMCLLLAYKIRYPRSMILLRGNHQTESLNKVYGFFHECCKKYSFKLWQSFVSCFNHMPIAGLISERILCMHGGLSPLMVNISEINSIKRPCDLRKQILASDLLWSDPDKKSKLFNFSNRGAGFLFGKQVVDLFCKANKLDLIVRAHQVVQDGYQFNFNRKIITIFSASNYCKKFQNDGALLKVGPQLLCSIVRYSVNRTKQRQDKQKPNFKKRQVSNLKPKTAEYSVSNKQQNSNQKNPILIDLEKKDQVQVLEDSDDSVYQQQQKKQKKIRKSFRHSKILSKNTKNRCKSQDQNKSKQSHKKSCNKSQGRKRIEQLKQKSREKTKTKQKKHSQSLSKDKLQKNKQNKKIQVIEIDPDESTPVVIDLQNEQQQQDYQIFQ